jgi:hypothetical protein
MSCSCDSLVEDGHARWQQCDMHNYDEWMASSALYLTQFLFSLSLKVIIVQNIGRLTIALAVREELLTREFKYEFSFMRCFIVHKLF